MNSDYTAYLHAFDAWWQLTCDDYESDIPSFEEDAALIERIETEAVTTELWV